MNIYINVIHHLPQFITLSLFTINSKETRGSIAVHGFLRRIVFN